MTVLKELVKRKAVKGSEVAARANAMIKSASVRTKHFVQHMAHALAVSCQLRRDCQGVYKAMSKPNAKKKGKARAKAKAVASIASKAKGVKSTAAKATVVKSKAAKAKAAISKTAKARKGKRSKAVKSKVAAKSKAASKKGKSKVSKVVYKGAAPGDKLVPLTAGKGE